MHVVLYDINLYQLHKNIKKIVIIVLFHLIGFYKLSTERFLGKVLSISVIQTYCMEVIKRLQKG